jgi:hypothetical protein
VLSDEAAALERAGQDELAHRIGEQARLMQRQVDYHLARARAAAAVRVPGVRTDIGGALGRLARAMRKIHGARGIEVACEVAGAPEFLGERQDFDEMAGNLLDNACKWAPRGAGTGRRRGGRPARNPDRRRQPRSAGGSPGPGVRSGPPTGRERRRLRPRPYDRRGLGRTLRRHDPA